MSTNWIGWLLLAQQEAGKAAAEAADAGAGDARPGADMIQFLTLISMLFLLYYFMILSPDRRRSKEKKQLLDGLKKNDKVVTIGGIFGVVANVKAGEDEVVLKIDEDKDVKLRVTRSSIAQILVPKDKEKED
jgi:preprotein translocase subunit YajC